MRVKGLVGSSYSVLEKRGRLAGLEEELDVYMPVYQSPASRDRS